MIEKRHPTLMFFTGPRAFPWMALLAAVFMGCATFSGPPGETRWQCDPAADAAVEQGQWEAAAEAHERLLEREPGNGLALYHLGYLKGKMGDREAEIDYYLEAIESGYDQDDQLYFNLGMAYGDLDPTAASEAFERAVELDPNSADNHFGLALMADTLGRTEQAVQALKTALELQPDHLDAMLLLARIDLDLSRWTEAAELLDRVLELDPSNEDAQELIEILNFRRHVQYERVALPSLSPPES